MTNSKSILHNGIALLNKAMVWWLDEIGEVLRLPGRLRKTPKIEFEVGHNQMPRLTSDTTQIAPGASKHIRLHFSDNALLYRKIKLPAAATRNINSVINYEFNRYFPMNVEDALYSFDVILPVLRSDSVEVEIWAVPKSLIENTITEIKSAYGILIKTLVVTSDENQDVLFYDIARAQKADIKQASRRKHQQFNAILILLLLAVVVYPIFKIDQYISELGTKVSKLQQDAKPIQNMRDKIRDRQTQLEKLLDLKQQTTEQTYIWSRVTASLSGKAVLNRMSISGNEVKLEGKATSVEQLIKVLEANPDIPKVVIIGPVEPAGDDNYETMKIALTVY